MNVEEVVVQKLRVLPPERQREVLDFVEFLESKSQKSVETISALDLAGKLIGSLGVALVTWQPIPNTCTDTAKIDSHRAGYGAASGAAKPA